MPLLAWRPWLLGSPDLPEHGWTVQWFSSSAFISTPAPWLDPCTERVRGLVGLVSSSGRELGPHRIAVCHIGPYYAILHAGACCNSSGSVEPLFCTINRSRKHTSKIQQNDSQLCHSNRKPLTRNLLAAHPSVSVNMCNTLCHIYIIYCNFTIVISCCISFIVTIMWPVVFVQSIIYYLL